MAVVPGAGAGAGEADRLGVGASAIAGASAAGAGCRPGVRVQMRERADGQNAEDRDQQVGQPALDGVQQVVADHGRRDGRADRERVPERCPVGQDRLQALDSRHDGPAVAADLDES
ncbi:hypothetical protein ACI1MP_34065 [Kitasatospora griseola]|uniref:hypothetical protein n=1 Tax=Kitasatospora griseola TaxID=2064 RepID=UPI003855AF44